MFTPPANNMFTLSEAPLEQVLENSAHTRHGLGASTIQLIPFSFTLVRVWIPGAANTGALTMPDSVSYRALSVPSALCSLSLRGRSQLYVVNTTNSEITLTSGTQLCSFFIYPAKVRQLTDQPLAPVDAIATGSSPSTDFSSHLPPTHFPESQPELV